jgi:hypothetical protein
MREMNTFLFTCAAIHLQCPLIKRLRYLLNYLPSLIELVVSYCSVCLHDGTHKLCVKYGRGITHTPFKRSSFFSQQESRTPLLALLRWGLSDRRISNFLNESFSRYEGTRSYFFPGSFRNTHKNQERGVHVKIVALKWQHLNTVHAVSYLLFCVWN